MCPGVGVNVRDEDSPALHVGISTYTACLPRGGVDQLARGLAAEWAQKKTARPPR